MRVRLNVDLSSGPFIVTNDLEASILASLLRSLRIRADRILSDKFQSSTKNETIDNVQIDGQTLDYDVLICPALPGKKNWMIESGTRQCHLVQWVSVFWVMSLCHG